MRRLSLISIVGLVFLAACNSTRKPSSESSTKGIDRYLAKHGEACVVSGKQVPFGHLSLVTSLCFFTGYSSKRAEYWRERHSLCSNAQFTFQKKISRTRAASRKILERYYPQLCEWATILLHGDRTKSEDIVHDFYLYVALTKPDLSRVENLDNYLFQSLRHMYLSTVSRASREATQSVSLSDYDSIHVALWAKPNNDTLQHQNELRRICNYAVWRKPQLRGASYFILKFFHGYRIQEIAKLACVPMAAVERRLSEARAEVREHLVYR